MSDKKEINQEEINLALYKGDINPLLNLMRYFVYFDKGKPLSRTIALDIIYGKDENRGWFIIEDDIGMGKENNPIIYHYENGLWKKNGAAFIRNILLLEFLDKSNIRMQHEVLNSITSDSRLFINRNILNSCKNFINLKNGVYDYMIGSLLSHDMKYYFTTQFDIEYNKDAQCPKFLKFIGEVIKSDDINFMQEIFGYAFYSGYDIALLCFFIGGGRNGKTTTQQLLRALVGSKNATSVTMQQLVEDGFASARLYEKYLVLAGDTGKKSIYDASIIKRATGGDSINAADKYQKNFEFINFAKFIIGTNNPPIFGEKTLAMKERLKFIKFSNKFPIGDINTDEYILDKLKEEVPGIFNWAMIGLQRLLQNHKFSYSKSTDESWELYSLQANPVLHFYQIFFDEDEDGHVLKKEFREKFKEWCIENEIIAEITDTELTKILGYVSDHQVKPKRLEIDGKRRQFFIGLSWKNTEDIKEKITSHPQQKLLECGEPLIDKINNVFNCMEYNNYRLDKQGLIDEGCEESIVIHMLEKKLIFKKPDGTFGVN